MRCKICNNEENNKLYTVKERMLNEGDSFRYMWCAHCGTLQRIDEVENIGKYYAQSYEPFNKRSNQIWLPQTIKKKYVQIMTHVHLPEGIAFLMRGLGKSGLSNLYQSEITTEATLLDVGAGNGTWGHQMAQLGFKNPVCVDKFYEGSIYKDIEFVKGEIFDLKDTYDIITFHHAFEHMDAPRAILTKVREMLSESGICIIRIPVCGCEAWEEYHENWFQIDAPRHLFLYTEKAIGILCSETGLRVEKICYDSMPSQFYISKAYRDTGKSYSEIRRESGILKKMRYCKKTFHANHTHRGDQAIFYIRKEKQK